MDMTLGITIIVLQIISGLLSGYLLNYVNQRGKNWADKKDLKAITDIVEDVKQKYQADNERLRAELTILTNRKTKDFTDEKESVVLFYTVLNEWLWDKTNISITNYDRDNYQELSEKLISLNSTYNQVNVLFSKMQLLVDNKALTDKGHEVIMETLHLHQFVEGQCKNLVRNLTSEKALVATIFDKELKIQDAPKEIKEMMRDKAQGLEEEKKAIIDEHFAKKNEFFKKAINLRHDFKDLAKTHLKS
jgi:hypothetical protein